MRSASCLLNTGHQGKGKSPLYRESNARQSLTAFFRAFVRTAFFAFLACGLMASPASSQTPGETPPKPEGPPKTSPESAVPPAETPAKGLKLSLADSIRLGAAKNFDIRVERINPKIRAQDITREEAAFDITTFADGSVSGDFVQANSALGTVQRTETTERTLEAGVRQRFKTGTSYEVSTKIQRLRNNSSFIRFDPAKTPTLTVSLTQNLLRNFGIGTNTTAIRVARNDERVSASAFKDRVINVVSDIENLYWELVFSIGDLEVKKKSLALAQDLLRRNKIQVEVGTMAPIEIIQAEASVASREADLITAERVVRDNDDRLKRALNLPTDIPSWNLQIQPTDQLKGPSFTPNVRDGIKDALTNRPDHIQAKIDIESKNIQVAFAKNQLLPLLDLTASAGLNGLDEQFDQAYNDFGKGDFYNFSIGFTFEYPLRNRAARSTLTQRRLEAAQALLSLKNLEERISLEVREAVRRVITEQNRVKATKAARILAERQLDAEEKKFAVGLSTNFDVLGLQEQLATAGSNELRALADHAEAMVTYWRATGTTLDQRNVRLEKAGAPPP